MLTFDHSVIHFLTKWWLLLFNCFDLAVDLFYNKAEKLNSVSSPCQYVHVLWVFALFCFYPLSELLYLLNFYSKVLFKLAKHSVDNFVFILAGYFKILTGTFDAYCCKALINELFFASLFLP